jgi:hypothetical protein
MNTLFIIIIIIIDFPIHLCDPVILFIQSRREVFSSPTMPGISFDAKCDSDGVNAALREGCCRLVTQCEL